VKGGGTPGYVCYGATKRGLPQMTDSLVAELEKGVQGYPKKKLKGKVYANVNYSNFDGCGMRVCCYCSTGKIKEHSAVYNEFSIL